MAEAVVRARIDAATKERAEAALDSMGFRFPTPSAF